MEDTNPILSLLQKIPKAYYLPIVFAVVGISLLGYGLIYLFGSHQSRENFSVEEFSQASSSAEIASNTIAVDVEGAVVKPGVYHLSQDARLQDGLTAAGGLSSVADRDFVAKQLNLAQKLSDGVKIYIPKVGETVQAATTNTGSTQTSLININSASLDSLDSLSGVGPVTAQKIVDGRPYQALDELVTKHILSQKVFDKIKSSLTLF